MIHLPNLIVDLGLILGAAAITTLLFKKLNQPVVLGYIIAGLLVGPHVLLFPSVRETESVEVWAEIGVIFLLFSLGLEFSFKKLMKVGGSASITAAVEAVSMLLLGFFCGKLLGWSTIDSIFLGGILSVSSTTIIIRAFEELNVKSQKFAQLVFGVLVVEDLIAILILVLLSTLAVSQQFEGSEMLYSVLKLLFFLVIWFLAGIFLLPTFLRKTRKLMSDETMLVVSLALCFLMVYLATLVGFSAALGAFIMGSILAETTQAERIEHLVKSVKDLFAAVFFVSVGMLIDPAMLLNYLGPVLIITLVTIFGKAFSSAGGALLSGQPLKQSVQAGLSLAQIGEFSFIIATLGLTLKVTSDFLYPIAVAVSAVTTFTTPYLIRSADPVYRWLDEKLPSRFKNALAGYSSDTHVMTAESDWKVFLKSYFTTTVLNSVVILAVILLSANFLKPFAEKHALGGKWGDFLVVTVTLLVVAPFLWGLVVKKGRSEAGRNLWQNRKFSRGPLIVLELVKILLAFFYIGFLISQFFSLNIALLLVFVGVVLILFMFSKRIQALYLGIETRFITNLNERETEVTPVPKLVPWDAHLVRFRVAPESPYVGLTLQEMGLREKYGVTVAMIERGKLTIPVPGRDARLFPEDHISVIGTDRQLEDFKNIIEPEEAVPGEVGKKEEISLEHFRITPKSSLFGKELRESGIREKLNGLIVGVERNGQRILNPSSTFKFEDGDIVWVVGVARKIKILAEEAASRTKSSEKHT